MGMSKAELKRKGEVKEILTARVFPELRKRLELYCDKDGWTKNSVIEKALEEFLDREEKKRNLK